MDRNAVNAAETVRELTDRIAALAAERQELRHACASHEVLEENRTQLARSQWALCHALIEQHLPSFAAA
jgi:nitrogen-specific signal transduction histidine kinase